MAILLLGGIPMVVQGQLAITEIMSLASTNQAGQWAPANPDFWELTNFGATNVDLAGYTFSDGGPGGSWLLTDSTSGGSLVIGPGESIVFVPWTTNIPDAKAFHRWWGEGKLPAKTNIIFYYHKCRFNSEGEQGQLWDAAGNLVDQVIFGRAKRGTTFTHDSSGQFGILSTNGVCGAFQAAECDDIGSPGWAPCGPIPLRFLRHPADHTVDAGMSTVTLKVEATGLPRPKYQWFFDGNPLANPREAAETVPIVVNYAGCGLAWKTSPRANELPLPNIQPMEAGDYFVVLDNGLERVTSAVARVTVNCKPTPPWIARPPADLQFPEQNGFPWTNMVAFSNQTATLSVLAGGYPAPTFQWSFSTDGTHYSPPPSLETTNATLVIKDLCLDHGGTYRVSVSNQFGVTSACATLTVAYPPRLRITEAMPLSVNPDFPPWWELTSLEDKPINLYGYRWDDSTARIGAGPTITNPVVIKPGESIIFVKGWTAEAFIRWWGATNLPSNLQVITYGANSFSTEADEVNLWNPMAMTISGDDDTLQAIDSLSFSDAVPGRSFWFAPDYGCSEVESLSTEGQCGAFRAAETSDVASPGWTTNTPPQLISAITDGSVTKLQWKAQPGGTILVEYAPALKISGPDPAGKLALAWGETATLQVAPGVQGPWTTLSGAVSGYAFTPSDTQRFFRLEAQWTGLKVFQATAIGTANHHRDPGLPYAYRLSIDTPADCPCQQIRSEP